MAVKSESAIISPRYQGKPFPKLMINSRGRVVLFTERTSGTIVRLGVDGYDFPIGTYLSKYFTFEDWTDYDGSITISNE